ncbi:MAG: T9SS type A sorting domain-containing protein [Candidatus Symbiothrix sp.]|nr:T9SS type A sorting domain-containing protein [Candidatus Symbiothrix sp.]
MSESESLDVSRLSKGVYLLRVTAGYEMTVVKFNKE